MTDEPQFSACFEQARAACAADSNDAMQVPIGFLNDLSQAVTRDEVLSAYSLWSKEIVDADRCTIALEGTDDNLVLTAMTGRRVISPGSQYDIRRSISGAVYQAGEPAYVPDSAVVDSPGVRKLAKVGYRTLIITPLMTNSRCFGVLNVGYHKPLTHPGKVISALCAIGRCLAMQLQVVEHMEGLSRMAHTDALTGAGNRYALYEAAKETWAFWEAEGRVFSFMSIDIDYFKQINDTYGHDVGDAVLNAFVKRLIGRCRNTDKVVRTGGEEFGMLLKNADLASALERAKRLCTAIGDTGFAVSGMQLSVTASFGVAQVLPQDQSFDDVMKRADMALYEAKSAGRDQVVTIDGTDMAA